VKGLGAWPVTLLIGLCLLGIWGVWTDRGPGVQYVRSSEIRLWIDPETGCEYFASSGERRYRADGTTPMCGNLGVRDE